MMKTLFFAFVSIVLHLTVAQNDCLPMRCDPIGPVIRFPFRLKGRQPEHCGYPGFDLSCTEDGTLTLDLQFPLTSSTDNIVLPLQTNVTIETIDYKTQKIRARNAVGRSCLPEKVPSSNSSASPFEVEAMGNGDGYTLFNCSNATSYGNQIPCLSGNGYEVFAFSSMYEITSLPPYSSCFKMYNISFVPDSAISGRNDEYGPRFYFSWRKPSCGSCEEKGKFCRLKNGGDAEEIECFRPQQSEHGEGASRNKKALIAGITAGAIFFVLIAISSYYFLIPMKKKYDGYKRITKILKNHKDMRPRRYSYAEVKKITNNFNEKLGTMHKGKLIDQTPVAVKMLNGSKESAEDFIDEVDRISRLQHVHMLQMIGFCVDGQRRALIYEFPPNGILEKFISLENHSRKLSWEKLHQIAIGIAKGIDYIHQNIAKRNVRLDISPQSIFLDDNFDPKILALPDCIPHFETVLQKEDVYSFGVLLMDIVGRRSFRENRGFYYPVWIYNHKGFGDERAIKIDADDDEEENEMVKKLCIVGLWCMEWFPCDRPSMKEVIQMLEGDKMPFAPPNPFDKLK